MAGFNLTEALSIAKQQSVSDRAIDAVKSAVRREIETLDPDVTVSPTEFFNHTFAPDFNLEWGDRSLKSKREVFLRPTLESSVVGGDIKGLGRRSPVIVTFFDEEDVEEDVSPATQTRPALLERATRQRRHRPGLLLTSAASLSHLATEEDVNPLAQLVRSSFIRAARGVLTADQVATLTPDVADDKHEPEGYRALVRETFTSDAAARIERTASLLELAHSEDFDFDSDIGPAFNAQEIQTVLPWLLEQESLADSRKFWRWVGGVLTLENLEKYAQSFAELDLTPLLRANARHWFIRRVALYRNDDEEVVSARESASTLESPSTLTWRIRGGMPSVEFAGHTLYASADGRRLKGRTAGNPVRWPDLREPLGGFDVRGVRLDGLSRSINVTGSGRGDVIDDVESVVTSIEDSFHIPYVQVVDSQDDSRTLEVDFERTLIAAPDGASMQGAIEAALGLLQIRSGGDLRADEIAAYPDDQDNQLSDDHLEDESTPQD